MFVVNRTLLERKRLQNKSSYWDLPLKTETCVFIVTPAICEILRTSDLKEYVCGKSQGMVFYIFLVIVLFKVHEYNTTVVCKTKCCLLFLL